MTWKEEVAATYKVHKLKASLAAADGDLWTQDQTGRMLGVSRASVGFTIAIARELLDASSGVHKCDSYTEALRFCMQKREDEVQKELADRMKRQMAENKKTVSPDAKMVSVPLSPAPTDSVEEIEPVSRDDKEMVVDLTNTIIHGDSIKWMINRDSASVDHIITDPPYAIDLGMLDQNNPHGGMIAIDRVEDTHKVEPNLALLYDFLHQGYRILKDNGFCIFFCDVMNWQYLYDTATGAGFRVQRWPFIWHKTHQCMNQRAEFNFTKNFEIAMVCRKPASTLVAPVQTSIFSCSASGYVSNPFAKPLELWSFLIKAVSLQGQYILDPFAGEGSCTDAILSSWRFPIGVEIEEKHYNIMLDSARSKYKLFYRNPTII